jgi:hypothetical protein
MGDSEHKVPAKASAVRMYVSAPELRCEARVHVVRRNVKLKDMEAWVLFDRPFMLCENGCMMPAVVSSNQRQEVKLRLHLRWDRAISRDHSQAGIRDR